MRFLHIGFYSAGQPKIAELEAVFESASDWMRYAANCWIIYTDKTGVWWTTQIQAKHPSAHFVVFEVNIKSRYGLHSKWVWDWIDNTDGHR